MEVVISFPMCRCSGFKTGIRSGETGGVRVRGEMSCNLSTNIEQQPRQPWWMASCEDEDKDEDEMMTLKVCLL